MPTLSLEDRTFDLAFVSQVVDEKFSARHVTMRIINVPGGYARFSISLDNLIVGTVQTPQATYRIVPVDAHTQRAYRLRAGDDAYPLRERRLAGAPVGRVSALERRHDQLEQLAAIAPDVAMSSEAGGTVNLRGGQLGNLPRGRVTETHVLQVLGRFSEFTGVSGPFEIRVKDVVAHRGGRRIEFEQLIRGIPVTARNVIRVNRAGAIVEIGLQLVAPDRAEELPILTQSQALERAVAALEVELRTQLDEIELLNPVELAYHSRPSSGALIPRYRFALDTVGRGSWEVTIDAHTGASEISDAMRFADAFAYLICRDGSSTEHPLKCTDPGAVVMWSNPLGGASICPFAEPMSPGNPCAQTDPRQAQAALLNADRALRDIHLANPDYCCDLLGGTDRTLDLVYKTSGASASGYSTTTESIVSAPGDHILHSIEIVWHEVGHHILHKYNPALDALYNDANQPFARIFSESFGDLVSASFALLNPGLSTQTNDPWIIADDPYGISPHNLADTTLRFADLNPPGAQLSTKSRVVSSYFYRIKTASGISHRRFLELLLQVADRLQDFDGNGVDLLDLKNTLYLVVSPAEAALLNAINEEFAEMGVVSPTVAPPLAPAEPAPAGVPAAPLPAQAAPLECGTTPTGQPSTRWLISWPTVAGATSYVAFLQATLQPWVSDVLVTQNTSLIAGVFGPGHQAYAFVAACNANGCGHTSNRVLIYMLPECQH